jgi:hypothetical protein
MRVIGPGSPGAARGRREAGRADVAGGFAALLGGGRAAAGAGHVGGIASLAALGGLLALQELPDAAERRRRGLRRGHILLDRLEELRLALLDGRLPEATLRALQAGLVDRGRSNEPRLAALLEEIELRVAVELAKLERLVVPHEPLGHARAAPP